ncbi:MAG: co-chaperone GroES family protein [Bacteroidota bacterium]
MDNLIIVGDRVLIAPDDGEQQTKAGLYLPASVAESERVQHGRVVKAGPGYVVPNPEYSEGETWKQTTSVTRYLPLQAEPGDLAYFMRKEAITVTYREAKYLIIPHSAILFLVRPSAEDILGTILPQEE